MEKNTQNRLVKARSPYLQQHATNPVDWYEWGEEALEKARTENKPLIISVGYAACHWCHVMAHESFSDTTIAEIMNKHFVCIKVDREERPDIDQIYMDAAHLVSGRGGWPLNAFALPDGRPFYAATYFPPQQWTSLLQQLSDLYQTNFGRIEEAAIALTQGINMESLALAGNAPENVSKSDYDSAFSYLLAQVDFKQGGFGGAPKFMMPIGWEFMLQYHYLTGNTKALEAVQTTLDAMYKGGIRDHIGGGFARYSTDAQWLVPHFEKMLYDNAQLISLYAHAYQITGQTEYAAVVEQTIAFAERELKSADGAFFASIDADSEHEEGKFYVWTKEEFEAATDPETGSLMAEYYNITAQGNWEAGKNILHTTVDRAVFAREKGIDPCSFEELLAHTNRHLLHARNRRIRPATDNKILTAWNALMLTAYTDAYRALGKTDYLDNALRLAVFLDEKMYLNDHLYRNYKDGSASVDAFLDDYALLASAWIALYEVTFDEHWLRQSLKLAEYVWIHFASADHPLFYYTSDEAEGLVARKIDYTDNVIASSNSVFAQVLLRLGACFDKSEYTQKATDMLSVVGEQVIRGGVYFANWAILAGKLTYPSSEVVITGKGAMQTANNLQKDYLPDTLFAGGAQPTLPLLAGRAFADRATIYICRDKACLYPVHTPDEAKQLLKKSSQ